MATLPLPAQGMSRTELMERLQSLKACDADWHDGRMFGLIYMAGQEIEDVAREAYGAFQFENALSPLAFPSLLKMETEFIAMVAGLLGGDEETAGAMTSGGTESILMAVKSAREWARENKPEIKTPEMVTPITAHPAFNKAAHYLGLKIVQVPVGPDYRADVKAMREAINENTIFLAGTAVTYPHGVVDPIEELGELAREKNLWLHVDACLGGFMLAFLRLAGRDLPPFDFQVPGVSSISADIHKYGFISKGASTVLYRDARLRRHQFFVYTDWPGGIYATPSLSGARPGGAIASAWAILHYLGREGFVSLALAARKAAEKMIEGIGEIDRLFVLGDPLATVFAFGGHDLNMFELGARMKTRGWHLDSQQFPPSLHVTVSPVHEKIVDPFLQDLAVCVEEAAVVKPGAESEEAAMYGLMASLPDRKSAKDFALQYLSDLYKLK